MIKGTLEQLGVNPKFINFDIKSKDEEMPVIKSSLYMDNIAVASLSVGKNILDDFSDNILPNNTFDIVELTGGLIPSLHSMSVVDGGRNVFEIYLKPSYIEFNVIGYHEVVTKKYPLSTVIIFFTKLNSDNSVDIFLPRAMLDDTELCREFLYFPIRIL